MNQTYEPMKTVRESLKISWYRSPVESARLKDLTRRSDLRGALQTLGHIVLLVLTGLFVSRSRHRKNTSLAGGAQRPLRKCGYVATHRTVRVIMACARQIPL